MTPRLRSGPGAFWVFLTVFVVYAYFMPRWADWNIDSRFDLTAAIVNHHTLSIDAYHYNTWDKAVYRGHYYSDKAPGTALLGVPVYALFTVLRGTPPSAVAIAALEKNSAWDVAVSLGESSTQKQPAPRGTTLGGCQRSGGAGNVQYIPWGNRLVRPFRDWALSKYFVTILSVSLISALFAAFFFWFLGFFTDNRGLRWVLTALYALGTDALPYATNFYSHQLAAGFLFTAFALLFLWSRCLVRGWAPVASGFLLGLGLFTEYTVALIILFLGAYALWLFRHSPKTLLLFLLAGTIPLLALFAYNQAIFGNPLDTGYSHDFCWSAAQAAGYAGFTSPKPGPLFDLTFGQYRGLFFMSPYLLLSVAGIGVMARRGMRLEGAVLLSLALVFILAISAYWGWNGGRVDGPRYLVPIIPFLAFPVVLYMDTASLLSVRALILAVLGAASVAVSWLMFVGGYLFPISWLRLPLTQYTLPALARNQIAPNAGYLLGLRGWESLVPLAGLLVLVLGAYTFLFPQHAEERTDSLLRAHPNTRVPHPVDGPPYSS